MSIGKIAPVQLTPSGSVKSMTNSLAEKGMTRYPGTGMYFFPNKDMSGRYRTGLNEFSKEILSIADEKERKAAQKEIVKRRKRLETATGFDLSPTSDFWNYSKYSDSDQAHVQPVKLGDSTVIFDFSDPLKEITFLWLKDHYMVATSYEAYVRGDKGPQVKYYVVDEEAENKIKFDRKQKINKATALNEELSPERRRKIAYLMGIPVSENTPPMYVYNLIDDQLKESEFKEGKFKGQSPLALFTQLVKQDNKITNAKFLVSEALALNVYRVRAGGAIYEGELKIADSEIELVNFLCDDDNQEDYLTLESKVKGKKLA